MTSRGPEIPTRHIPAETLPVRQGEAGDGAEPGVLANRPRAATVVALGPTVCEIIRKNQFAKAIEAMPPILRSLTRLCIEPLSGGRLLPSSSESARQAFP